MKSKAPKLRPVARNTHALAILGPVTFEFTKCTQTVSKLLFVEVEVNTFAVKSTHWCLSAFSSQLVFFLRGHRALIISKENQSSWQTKSWWNRTFFHKISNRDVFSPVSFETPQLCFMIDHLSSPVPWPHPRSTSQRFLPSIKRVDENQIVPEYLRSIAIF